MTPAVLFAPLRRQHILDRLAADGRVEAGRLAADLSVSTESIRKDLAELAGRGLLRRVHGGAIAVDGLTTEPAVGDRTGFDAEKAAIARAALAHIHPGTSAILLDAGSTTARLAGLLPNETLTVATNSLPIATTLTARTAITVALLGGTLRRPTLAAVGAATVAALAGLNVDIAFLGSNAVTAERGLTTPDEHEAVTKHAMLAAARRRILLVDHSKFGRQNLHRHAKLRDIDLVITDAGIDAAVLAALEQAGVAVEIAG